MVSVVCVCVFPPACLFYLISLAFSYHSHDFSKIDEPLNNDWPKKNTHTQHQDEDGNKI